MAAPGTPEPYTRFDLFEETRRRGFPVAFPADPARPPPLPDRAEAERLRTGAGVEIAIIEPALHPLADGRPVLEPRFGATRRRKPEDGPLAPDATALDMKRFFDVASPEGVVVPFETAWPGDLLRPPAVHDPAHRDRPLPLGGPARNRRGRPGPTRVPGDEALQPPEYLSRIGGAPERELLRAPIEDEPRLVEVPPPPALPGHARAEAAQGREPRAPGQEMCVEATDETYLFTPQPPDAKGGGGGGEEVGLNDLLAPCPCKCKCIRYSSIIDVFVEAGKLKRNFFDPFGKDTKSTLGVSTAPTVVVATPDGFVEQVRNLLTLRATMAFGTPASTSPGGVAPADGISATLAARAPATLSAQRLLWPELDGTLAADTRVVAPVGPGPGLPGVGAEPLVPANGATLRAAPGALFAGIAPARDTFDGFLRGTP